MLPACASQITLVRVTPSSWLRQAWRRNQWFRRHTWRNQELRVSRTTVISDTEAGSIVGCVSLSGCFCVLTHPLDDDVRALYAAFGFEDLPFDPGRSMAVRIADLARSGFGAAG